MSRKSKVQENYQALAASSAMRYDENQNVIYGQREGYEFLLIPHQDSRYPYMLTIQTAVKNMAGTTLTKAEQKEITKSNKNISYITHKGNTISFQLKQINNQEKLRTAITETLNGIVFSLRTKEFYPCCSHCGQNSETSAYRLSTGYVHLCNDCELRLRDQIQLTEQQESQKKENVIAGIVGAVVGSLLGVLCIVILSRLGYVAALSGIVMAIGVLKGYELLSKKLSTKGIVISCIIMLIMTYVGDRLDWALLVSSEWGLGIFESYRAIPALIADTYIESANYYGNLVILYMFLLVGAVPTIYSTIKENKNKNTIGKVGSQETMNYMN